MDLLFLAIVNLITILPRPTCFNRVMDLLSLPWTSLLLPPHMSPLDTATLVSVAPFPPPTHPGVERPST